MDRRLRYGLLGVGLFLLLFAPIERLYAYPRLAKAPLGVYAVPLAEGTGSYFDVARLQMVHGAHLRTTRVVKADPRAGSARVAVWDMFLNTVDLETGGALSVIQERVAFDRVSGMPVHCCGETPRHDGLMLNFPFDTRKAAYPFWDPVAGRSAPALFVREEQVMGLRTYRFEQRIRGARIRPVELPGSLAGRPEMASVDAFLVDDDDKTVWVEPVTGRIIRGQDHSHQTVQDAGGVTYLTGFDAIVTYTDDTVAANVAAARKDLAGLRLARVLLPVGAALLGAALLALGLLAPTPLRAPAGHQDGGQAWVVRPDGVVERLHRGP